MKRYYEQVDEDKRCEVPLVEYTQTAKEEEKCHEELTNDENRSSTCKRNDKHSKRCRDCIDKPDHVSALKWG